MEQRKQTILEWYREKEKKIDAPCGGNGTCGKCKVHFLKQPKEATGREKKLLTAEEIENHIRLACMTEMTEDAFEVIGEVFTECDDRHQEQASRQPSTEILPKAAIGVAIDIGTTTLVMRALNLLNGQELVTLSEMNPQRMYGADVMTRIRAANEGKQDGLQKMIKSALEQMFEKLLQLTGMKKCQIKKVAIVGNTTMLHLLLGYSCKGLGAAPFEPVSLELHKWWGNECEGGLSEQAEIVILPGISAFIGADIVAGIYACDMDLYDEIQMLVDVGTNGEMVLGNKKGFLVTSTAAGPVFEGGNISCGMPAVNGCITHFTYDSNQWRYEMLGEKEPKGICGSGLIDLLAGMYEHGIIDENGTLEDVYFEEGYCVLHQPKICLYQSDIRELQMGKAAIRAGMELLEKREEPVKLYLAGVFGAGIRPDSAETIGLFSKMDIERMQPVANTALKGAQKFLLEEDGEVRLRGIVSGTKEILLANEEGFEEAYIQYMQL